MIILGGGVDFNSNEFNITFPPRTLTQCGLINITDDSILEGIETFSVVVSSDLDVPAFLVLSAAVVTIVDNDGKGYGF